MTDDTLHSGPAGTGPLEDWESVARYLSGESSADELRRIEAILGARPEDRDLLVALDRATLRMSDDIPMDLDVEAALSRVRLRQHDNERGAGGRTRRRKSADTSTAPATRWRVQYPAIAAAAVLAVGVGSWVALRDSQPRQVALATPGLLATGVGVRDSLTLSDGTRVVLGPMSSVAVSPGYGSASREVLIRGDAWFDVVHDAGRPFTVRAGAATIVDVGTEFAVRSDAAGGVAVTVTEGSVSLRAANNSAAQGVVLNAGDNGILDKGGQVIARRGTVSADDIAWMRGRLVLREAPIDEVVSSVRRWYGIELTVDTSLMDRHITATFEGESADRVLEVLRLILGADIVRRGDTAVVRPAGGRMR